MGSAVIQRADGYWYLHDASISHTDIGPFMMKAHVEKYRDTGEDTPINDSASDAAVKSAGSTNDGEGGKNG